MVMINDMVKHHRGAIAKVIDIRWSHGFYWYQLDNGSTWEDWLFYKNWKKIT